MEEVQNNPINTSIQQTQNISTKKTKESNKQVIIALLFGIIGIILGGLLFFYYFPCEECVCNKCNCTPPKQLISECDCEKTIEDNTKNYKEVELTDQNIINDLNKKLSYIFNLDIPNNRSFYITGSMLCEHIISHLGNKGGISEDDKLYTILRRMPLSEISEEEIEDAVDMEFYNPGVSQYRYKTKEEIKENTVYDGKIDGKEVAKKYKEIYGQELIRQYHSEGYLFSYVYSEKRDLYYHEDIPGGCAGFTVPYLYINRYTTDTNHRYVYISTGGYSTSEGNFLNDMVNGPETTVIDLGDISLDDFTINEENYKQFTEYKFIFDKSADDNYYFSKTEKITN